MHWSLAKWEMHQRTIRVGNPLFFLLSHFHWARHNWLLSFRWHSSLHGMCCDVFAYGHCSFLERHQKQQQSKQQHQQAQPHQQQNAILRIIGRAFASANHSPGHSYKSICHRRQLELLVHRRTQHSKCVCSTERKNERTYNENVFSLFTTMPDNRHNNSACTAQNNSLNDDDDNWFMVRWVDDAESKIRKMTTAKKRHRNTLLRR